MTDPDHTPELRTYKGNCHCGAFKFNIKVPELTSVTECNCNICFKRGYKWVFPGVGCFTIEKDDKSLKDYELGKGSMLHKFCPTCGTSIIGERHGMTPGTSIAVNARALQDVDLWSLRVNKYDGATHEGFNELHPFTGPEPTAEIKNSKLYTGSCHCGAVTLALETKGPLNEEVEVIGECDCSICARMGRILTYRPPAQISIHLTPGTDLSSYSFAGKQFEHKFCPVCGVAVGVDDTIENMKAVNLRCLEEVPWGDIETFKNKGYSSEPQYVIPQ